MNKTQTQSTMASATLSHMSYVFLVVAFLGGALQTFAQTGSGGSDGSIERCTNNLGTLAIAEPQSHMISELSRYKLGSPSTMLRMIAQESGCFTVVERGAAMQNIQQERALAGGGMMQQGSNMGAGQLQAADFVMTPAVQFADSTGGMAGAVGSLLGRLGGTLGALGGLAGGVSFKEAETTILVADVRSGIQVASAEGKASKMNFSLGGWGWGGFGWASAGGYSKTPEGKLVAASLLDNFNRVVLQIRDKPSLIQSSSASSQRNAANSIQATQLTAPAPSAPMPAAAPVQIGGVLPAGLIGNFQGKFSGTDQGTFNVIVATNGAVTGVAFSSAMNQTFSIAGMVTASGQMMLAGNGRAGAATYNGVIDQSSGRVSGSWTIGGNPAGSFDGQKR
jgi:hypothetical protein